MIVMVIALLTTVEDVNTSNLNVCIPTWVRVGVNERDIVLDLSVIVIPKVSVFVVEVSIS